MTKPFENEKRVTTKISDTNEIFLKRHKIQCFFPPFARTKTQNHSFNSSIFEFALIFVQEFAIRKRGTAKDRETKMKRRKYFQDN